jgi:hypothetical protein
VLATLAAGCGGGGGDGTDKYPAAVERNFLSTCEQSALKGRPTLHNARGRRLVGEKCRCVLNRLEATLPLKQFKQEEAAIRLGAAPSRKVSDALAGCF